MGVLEKKQNYDTGNQKRWLKKNKQDNAFNFLFLLKVVLNVVLAENQVIAMSSTITDWVNGIAPEKPITPRDKNGD